MITGLILIIVGAVFLLQNLGYISEGAWAIIWPAALIVIGLGLIFKRRGRGFFFAPLEGCFFCGKKKQDMDRHE